MHCPLLKHFNDLQVLVDVFDFLLDMILSFGGLQISSSGPNRAGKLLRTQIDDFE